MSLSRIRQLALRHSPALLLLVGLVAIWQAVVTIFEIQPYLLPGPVRAWQTFLEVRGLLPEHIHTTMTVALTGLGIACLVGIATAALLAGFAPLRRAVYPLLVISQNIPMLVLAPLVMVWFGFGLMPKVLVVVLMCYFPIVVSTTDGLVRSDRELVELARSLGAGRMQVLRKILLPSGVPAFFAGLQISATYAVLAAVISEWVGGTSGLGLFIARSQRAYRVDQMFVAVVVIALASLTLFALVHLAARIVMPWQRAVSFSAQSKSTSGDTRPARRQRDQQTTKESV